MLPLFNSNDLVLIYLWCSIQLKAVTDSSWERTGRTCKDHLVHPTTLGHPFWACAQAVLQLGEGPLLKDTLLSPM